MTKCGWMVMCRDKRRPIEPPMRREKQMNNCPIVGVRDKL
jgi:hypothetical protein